MIINKKKKTKKTGNIIKEIIEILDSYKVKIETNETFDDLLDTFLLSYIKISKLIDNKRDEIENENIVKNILDDIIEKKEQNDFLIPELNIKKINIKEKCNKYNENNSGFTIVMK